MRGCRAVKVRASGFSAFESVNARYAGTVSNRGLVLDERVLPQPKGETRLCSDISRDVFLLKLTPGLNPAVFDMLAAMGYKGIVIEAFGLGGVTVLHKGLRGIHRCLEDGISVVVTTQCLYDSSDLRVYQVGNKLLEMGVHRLFISMGADGVYAADGNEELWLPNLPGNMVNTTGCGDAFMGALAWAYLEGMDLKETALAGLAAGSIAMESQETINPAMSATALKLRMAE